MKIFENGKVMEGIPYPVAVWDAKNDLWDDSIEELSAIFANSEDEAIELAKDYMLESVYYNPDTTEEEREKAIKYYSNEGNYTANTANHELHLYVFEKYTDKGGTGETALYTDKREAVKAARDEWGHLCNQDQRNYRRDVCGTWRVYAVSIPYADLTDDFEGVSTENALTEYEEFEAWNALKED